MRSIADIKKWQEAQFPAMGGILSTVRSLWRKRGQPDDFKTLNKQGYFNLTLAPTAEELCEDDNNDNDDEGYTFVFGDDCEEYESLEYGQQLRSKPWDWNWAYDESKSALENRRPGFYRNLFDW